VVAASWRSWLPWCVVIATGWAAICLYSYPGFTSFDSIEQLAQARGLARYSDWHPPILPLTWKLLELIVRGPLLMVLLQCALLLAGTYALCARVMRPRFAVLATLAVFLWPPVFTLMAVVWKDALMAGVLVASFAALTSKHPRLRAAAIAGLLYATMLRHNAIFAVTPLLVIVAPWPAQRGAWTRRLVGLSIAVALFVTAQLTNRLLADVRTYPFTNSVAVLDLAGMLRFGEPRSDAELDRMLAGVPLVVHTDLQFRGTLAFNPEGWFDVVVGPKRLMERPATEAQRAAVLAAWRRFLIADPTVYLLVRARIFREVVGLRKHDPYHWQIANAAAEDVALLGGYGVHIARPEWQIELSYWLADVSARSLLFRAWPYLAIALALCFALRRDKAALAVVASGIGYEAALFFVAPSVDFRYSTWLVICALVGFVLRLGSIEPRTDAPR
jgi:hypothetical protein